MSKKEIDKNEENKEPEAAPSEYYKDMIPELIRKYKHLVNQCFTIVDQPIDNEISADKRHAELRSKRDAMTDAQHYAKEIDNLENVRNGVDLSSVSSSEANGDTEEPAENSNWARRRAKKPS